MDKKPSKTEQEIENENLLLEQFITIDNVSPEEKTIVLKDFFNILKCCKEISNTMFPIPGTNIKDLTLIEIRIHSVSCSEENEKKYEFSGSFGLINEPNDEYRCINGVMVQKPDFAKVVMEITRLGPVPPEDKVICTTDCIRTTKNGMSVRNETFIKFKGTKKHHYIFPFFGDNNEYDKEAVRLLKIHKTR